jgi:transposase
VKKRYPSDITHTQFNKIREILEGHRKKTKPRAVDLYDIFCGLLYLLKSGCQWRMIPREYPKWELIYFYNNQWRQKNEVTGLSVLEEVLKKIGIQRTLPQCKKS